MEGPKMTNLNTFNAHITKTNIVVVRGRKVVRPTEAEAAAIREKSEACRMMWNTVSRYLDRCRDVVFQRHYYPMLDKLAQRAY